jgi:DNA replication protein DnaC
MTAEIDQAAIRAEFLAAQQGRRLQAVLDAMGPRHAGFPLAPEITGWVRELAATGEPANLILVGPTGTGKTTQVWQAIAAAVEAGWAGRWLMWRGPDLAAALRPSSAVGGVSTEDTIEHAQTVDLLILDDLGSAKTTEWQTSQLDRIVDERWERKRPTVVTSNQADLRTVLSDRIASRLYHEALVLPVVRASYRASGR